MDTKVLRDLSYGVYIVSTRYDEKLVGCVLNSAIQVTQNKIAISVNVDNYTNKCINEFGKFALSILDQECDPKLIGTFGYNSSKDIDKFNNVSFTMKEDLPIINNGCGYIICEVVDKLDVDTHTIFIGEIIELKKLNNSIPMTYSYYHKELKGITPKNAPTYIENDIVEKKTTKNTFVCSICGYKVETELDELPDDFKCPICGKGKEFFKKI